MKVYVVTAGEYSDYHIIGVRLRREDAEKLALLFSGPRSYYEPEIEEYDTNDFTELFYGLKQYYAYFNKKLELLECYTNNSDNTTLDDYFREGVREIQWICSSTKYVVQVYAKDKEHAEKIAKDRLAQFCAEKEGL